MNKIRISDPLSITSAYIDEITSTVDRVIKSGWYIGGEEVINFENEFSEYLNINYTISTGSGTDALQLALRSLGIGTGDKVVIVSHTAVATVAAIEMVGAIPIFVDIDPKTYTIDIKGLSEALISHNSKSRKSIKAIVPVHIYGHPAPYSSAY
ncbi:DegT/DnrJ/EryC1/StrS family aminotransferase [Fulvivirgaceae bacterium BMA10]|uniref:DegT/DnrJ/EryC1/StrS family aminotransferase n=1 Tax=Splendidivirga corallicola TaxID=3051826 RepID=A0ABT8KKG1_9BACT|nr:DegT/DnrJ/EryC1/StrS family aminotransferase [Fulvivirgaceae bacterium BMA10]